MDALVSRLAALCTSDSPVPSFAEVSELVDELKRRRSKVNWVKSLQELTRKAIINNRTKYFTKPDNTPYAVRKNPFGILPNILVQELISETENYIEKLWMSRAPSLFTAASRQELVNFLEQLLNPNILEIKWPKYFYLAYKDFVSFTHILVNCPKLRSVKITDDVWQHLVVQNKMTCSKLFETMGQLWPNLTLLKLNVFTSDMKSDNLLRVVTKSLPRLNGLDISMCVKTFSTKGVKHLSAMKTLTYLKLRLSGIEEGCDLSAFIQAAGEIKSLQKFAFCSRDGGWDSVLSFLFVEVYGREYHDKKLVVQKLWCNSDLNSSWPACLSVEELYIKCNLLEFERDPLYSCKNLLDENNSCVKKLYIGCVPYSKVYLLVEKFGPRGLTHLDIQFSFSPSNETLDPFRLVAACPKIKSLSLRIKVCTLRSPYQISPVHFQHCDNYELRAFYNEEDRPEDGGKDFQELYKWWLLGSRKFPKYFEVKTIRELDTLLWVLKHESPKTSLDQVQELHFRINHLSEELYDKAVQAVFLLMVRSPYLKSVFIGGTVHAKPPALWFVSILQELGISLRNFYGEFNYNDGSWPLEEESITIDD